MEHIGNSTFLRWCCWQYTTVIYVCTASVV